MPKIWDGCVKIHAGCGGVARWEEAIRTPGVGYFGRCVECGRRLDEEEMIPLEFVDIESVLSDGGELRAALADIEWNLDEDWESNQSRLEGVLSRAGHSYEYDVDLGWSY